jgi:hypothetical protein
MKLKQRGPHVVGMPRFNVGKSPPMAEIFSADIGQAQLVRLTSHSTRP